MYFKYKFFNSKNLKVREKNIFSISFFDFFELDTLFTWKVKGNKLENGMGGKIRSFGQYIYLWHYLNAYASFSRLFYWKIWLYLETKHFYQHTKQLFFFCWVILFWWEGGISPHQGHLLTPNPQKKIVKPEFGSISKRNLHLILSSIKMMNQ